MKFAREPTVLVVDDEPLVTMLLEDMLSELGCKALVPAASVHAALAALADNAVDAAIIDLSLGAENSTPLAEELAKCGIPFAFATGHSQVPHGEHFKAAPILAKPFDLAALTRVLDKILTK